MDIDQKTKFDYLYTRRGFKKIESDFEDTALKRLNERLSKIDVSGDYNLPTITMNDVKSEVKSMRKQLFPQVGLQVDSFVPEAEFHNDAWNKILKKMMEKQRQLSFLYSKGLIGDDKVNEEMEKEYLKHSTKINVFEIPIIESPDNGSTIAERLGGPAILLGNKTKEFLRKMPVFAEAIFFGTKDLNELAIATYAHELTHFLVDRHKSVIENYYDYEMMSVFKEKQAIYYYDKSEDKHLYKIWEIKRLKNIQTAIKDYFESSDEYDRKKDLMYIQGPLYAEMLFNKYINGTPAEKKMIDNEISNILNGHSTVRTVLDKLGITLDDEAIERYFKKVEGYVEEMRKYEKPKTRATETPYDDDRIAQGVTNANSRQLTPSIDKIKKDIEE